MASSSSAETPLLYSCIAHNSTILSECLTSASSKTSSVAAIILPKIAHDAPQRMTYTHGAHHIHYSAEAPSAHPDGSTAGGLTFLVVADSSLGRRVGFAFLTEARRRFFAAFPPDGADFAEMPYFGAAAFNADLRAMMVDFGTAGWSVEEGGGGPGGSNNATAGVRKDLEDVRGIMTRNIEGLLERGERIDLLVDKTDRLGGSAREFRVRSRGLKRRMWWKNAKLMSLLAVVLVLIVLAIVIAVRNTV